jgi:aminoglycoside phosphotransferase (APT) family kinase protein
MVGGSRWIRGMEASQGVCVHSEDRWMTIDLVSTLKKIKEVKKKKKKKGKEKEKERRQKLDEESRW